MKALYTFWEATALGGAHRSRVLRTASLVLFLALWELLGVFVRELPTPLETGTTFVQLITVGEPILGRTLQEHTLASILVVLKGSLIGFALAIPLGVLMGWSRIAGDVLEQITELFRPIPPLAWIPLAFVLFRGLKDAGWFQVLMELLGTQMSVTSMVQIFVVFVGAFFPLLLNTIQGVKSVDRIYIEVARVAGATQMQIIRKVVLPAALPSIITGARVGLGVGWMCVVAAEMIGGSSSGVGLFIWNMYSIGGSSAAIVCGMIAIGMVGYAMNEGILALERRLIKWS
ncbi:ABC transporter permease [Methermicoccus shengliensis]|uniref:ABC transporter permease n=1 Tax=Methermicoccus shengliensis TaxID=660064 RepID=UPI0006944693|nr:ABC transporter permease [Methermicoccus shengliensis]KUK05261.1 MAG: ABC-type nitrate/sulfonate/bicarbonate transport system, permease component [Euryarchaeota archaeon 55_53]KUK30324.1 MAG: ABC-type nitrate/sulfonate/bicarbonate transport system, permease component [Methanosarcinales archeaon 56_1174]MDI3487848.1 sulfonate transport system permease protein [Methanosarcinales archaeon]MDN5294505.1 sulfonate transport system permease protein [Methanosarcinales archaeon]